MVDILSNLSMGLHVAFQPFNLFVALVGLVLGVIVGFIAVSGIVPIYSLVGGVK